ncbi:MAG: hypothetical protein IT343_20815 [Candidatus Melainabacteria bacterium]|jgi:hypothetical protein|nr:hypothetical protein [Candidatus Melainabacteria bacterium]
MNSPDPTNQIHALEISIEKLIAKPAVAGDGTAASLASQMMQKDNLKQDLMMQVRANQNQMIKDQMEQARLRSEMAYKDQQAQGRALQEQTQRDRQTQAKLRQEQIERYEQQQARLKQEQQQREQLDQARRRLEQQQRDQLQQSRMRQEQIQREQQMQARLKQEQQMQARLKQEQQLQKDRAEQEKLGGKFGEKNTGKPGDKNNGKPKTAEQLAKDEEARAFSARSELSLTSIAFCSPLMLFGMGAAMSIFDNFSSKGKNQAMLEQRKKNAQQQELSEYARAQADKKFKEMLEGKNLTNQSNLSMDANAANFGVEKGEKRSEKAVKEEREKQKRVNRFIEAEQNPVVARKNDSLEVKKLWKERQRLLENLERVRGQGSLALVSKLVSQLETLDRSLKRLGCDPQA